MPRLLSPDGAGEFRGRVAGAAVCVAVTTAQLLSWVYAPIAVIDTVALGLCTLLFFGFYIFVLGFGQGRRQTSALVTFYALAALATAEISTSLAVFFLAGMGATVTGVLRVVGLCVANTLLLAYALALTMLAATLVGYAFR